MKLNLYNFNYSKVINSSQPEPSVQTIIYVTVNATALDDFVAIKYKHCFSKL